MFTIDDFRDLKTDKKTSDDRLLIDRNMYLRGKAQYPDKPPSDLSKRDHDCYMMGFNAAKAEQWC